MSYTKAEIYNLALSALLLTKKVADVDNENSKEVSTLNVNWSTALGMVLADLDLDGTASQKQLELIETDPTDLWGYAYKYPSNCAQLRRLQNGVLMDTADNQISRRVAIHNGKKVIFTNQECAIIEYIPNDFDLKWLSAPAALAIAYQLALLSAPLIAGKGAANLRAELQQRYNLAKSDAQELDRLENANFVDPEDQSDFVRARTT